MTKSMWLLSLAVVTVFPSFAALAEEVSQIQDGSAPQDPNVKLEAQDSGAAVLKNDLATGIPEIHGFVEALGRADLTAPGFDFLMQQAEVDIVGNWKNTIYYRFDLQYDAYYTEALAIPSVVEQAIVDVQAYEPLALKFGFGRFNAPMGFEALDPMDRWLASYSQVFNYMDPFLLTGARFSGAVGWFDWVLWGAQGWEVVADNNSDKTFGGRLGFKPSDKFGFGLAGTYGSEQAVGTNKRLNLALDWLAGSFNGFSIGGEVNFRREGNSSTVNTKSDGTPADGMALGVIVESQYRFHDNWAIAWRYDFIRDWDGVALGRGDVFSQSATVAPTFFLFDHLRIQLEYRANFMNVDAFAKDNSETAPGSGVKLDQGLTASQLFQQPRLLNGALANGVAGSTGLSQTLTLQVVGYF